jgi:hypothetical protein
MTEHEKDRLAFEACGYTRLYFHIPSSRWASGVAPLARWSSADAAIEHAERGKFDWVVGRNDSKDAPAKYQAEVNSERNRGDDWRGCESGDSDSPGLAIRNAILAWKERNP